MAERLRTPRFPRYGKLFRDFSMLWKIPNPFFHAMENFFGVFPCYGKMFSTAWKTPLRCRLLQSPRKRKKAAFRPPFGSSYVQDYLRILRRNTIAKAPRPSRLIVAGSGTGAALIVNEASQGSAEALLPAWSNWTVKGPPPDQL